MTGARTLALCLLSLLCGCAVGPNYHRPVVEAPQHYLYGSPEGAAAMADLAWWDLFRDPVLDSLVRTALTNGYDARIAAARVEQARAAAAEAHGQLFPGVGYAGNADRGKNAVFGNAFPSGTDATQDGFDAYLGAAWEFDLWGRVRRLDEEARDQYLASEEGRRGVVLSLVGNVASAYYDLLELDEEREIARSSAASFRESLRLFKRQLEGGVVSKLDTESAEAALATSEARIPALELAIIAKQNQIRILLGEPPGDVARGAKLSDQALPPDVPAGLPSDLLERRPDVRQAEYAAMAANANIGVTIGGFLPRIGLSAIFGGVSTQLSQITAHGSELWSVGANFSGPLFQGGSLHGQYEFAKAAWDQARLQYEATALSAFGDVTNALASRGKLQEERDRQEKAVAAYEDAVALATERYKAGRASYFEVIQEQLLLFPAQVSLAQTKRDQFKAAVQLYEALGGGWKIPVSDWAGGSLGKSP
jgi:multidrug efflux system outer membrane protein